MTPARRLAAQLRNLRTAGDALPDALVLLDRAGRLRWCNRAAERLLGLQRGRDRAVVLAEHLRTSELGAWLRNGARESIQDVPAPAAPQIHLHASLIPFGEAQSLFLA